MTREYFGNCDNGHEVVTSSIHPVKPFLSQLLAICIGTSLFCMKPE